MTQLEELTRGATIKGIIPNENVTAIDIQWHGNDVVELTYKDAKGQPYTELIFRDREATLEIVKQGEMWSFDGDGALLRLVSEAHRIRLAHLFDPLLAVHTSLVQPLPHQITAVYGEMLARQPLRYLLADDPGAGKTIMAGLFIRELLIRGDLQRCLIVCPGSLAVQWQDELAQKFHLPFEILTSDCASRSAGSNRIESARTGNALAEIPLAIARLDKLSRSDELQAKLKQTDWDLIICDEAHKMSASFFGGEIKETKRYKLGKLLSTITRHFLLMTATPHNGKEEDFQLFLALLDGDRFEGRFRDGVHIGDTSDLMRRMVKEDLLKFDSKPLFPERKAHAVSFPLSDLEAVLYRRVSEYVREQFNRADALANDGRKGTVGFALTILQRRLASSPEAIYKSLQRRKERLENWRKEEELFKRGQTLELNCPPTADLEDIEDDFEDVTAGDREQTENEVVDLASAARTIEELKLEIAELIELEKLALQVKRSGKDRKWEELSKLLCEEEEMFDAGGYRRKLVIFTEHRDTLSYLCDRITTLLGCPEAVVTIHGSMGREERKQVEEAFKQDASVQVLIATDAAGEGINLQRAHLMVNYDLPWNPNRLEQRFGRIHRIGQTEVCHLWNLVAEETREGEVYYSLLKKLEIELKALGGKVFDVLGVAIAGKELKQLLVEAIRYGDLPEVRARLEQEVTGKLDRDRLQELLRERALARDAMDVTKVQQIRQDMERIEARRLHPHFISAFFLQAFTQLGGTIRQREAGRYEISNVPGIIRSSDRVSGIGDPIGRRYERICFDKELIGVPGKPPAQFICPGHPLLDATIGLTLERHRNLLKQGAILVDPSDVEERVRALVYLEHAIQDARTNSDGRRRVVSRRMQYVEIGADGKIYDAGYAPYLDYRPIEEAEKPFATLAMESFSLRSEIETKATSYAISHLVSNHLQEVRQSKEELIDKTIVAVRDRLTKEINYWDERAAHLRLAEEAGKPNAKLNSTRAQQRADDLAARLQRRLAELEQERLFSPLPPVVVGGALIVSAGLLQKLQGKVKPNLATLAQEKQRIERLAMDAVMAAETALGYAPKDVSDRKCGYDIESQGAGMGRLRFIEVKGRIAGAETVTVTKNEILTALNKPENYILALVQVSSSEQESESVSKLEPKSGNNTSIRYIRQPFRREPDFGASSVNYSLKDLWEQGSEPI